MMNQAIDEAVRHLLIAQGVLQILEAQAIDPHDRDTIADMMDTIDRLRLMADELGL